MTETKDENDPEASPRDADHLPPSKDRVVPIVLAVVVLVVLAVGGGLVARAESKINKIALASSPKPVTVTRAVAAPFQPSRTYVGSLDAWVVASVGPQIVAGYIDTVLVRPGAVVNRGEVLATIDCRDADAANRATAAQARAVDAQQRAIASESGRVQTLLDAHLVAPSVAEAKAADTLAAAADLKSMKANMEKTALGVSDCILRAPFDGEVATRTMDPGGFVRPGMSIVSVVNRNTVRVSADVPEIDFAAVTPGTDVRISMPGSKTMLTGTVSRRAPAADPLTRTVHFEVDLPNPDRRIPVGTTGEVHLKVGQPKAATQIPLYAAAVSGSNAAIFTIDGEVARARTVHVMGEIGGSLFVDLSLAAGTEVVTEGRALLADGDKVSSRVEGSDPVESK